MALQLESTEEGIVNVEMNRVLYVFDINGQQVEWGKKDIQIESATYSSMSVKLKAEMQIIYPISLADSISHKTRNWCLHIMIFIQPIMKRFRRSLPCE